MHRGGGGDCGQEVVGWLRPTGVVGKVWWVVGLVSAW